MSAPTILSSSGMPLRSFGGPDAWKVYQSGDYIVSIEMIEDEPGCAIWPARGAINGGVYAVCMSAFPYWLHQDGRPTQAAYGMAMRGLEQMNRDLSRGELVKLLSVVIDAFPWIARMPPKSKERAAPLYEATARVNGQTLHERAI